MAANVHTDVTPLDVTAFVLRPVWRLLVRVCVYSRSALAELPAADSGGCHRGVFVCSVLG